MASEYHYGTFANYSPRGTSELSAESRNICGRIKGGDAAVINSALQYLKKRNIQVLQPFLNSRVTLVPVPRSAPLPENALWPAKVIADVLAFNGYGREVRVLIERTVAVQKSSTSPASERPLIPEHMASMQVHVDMLPPDTITLVDDVLTKGSTAVACANLLQERFPAATIRVFAMIRTQGLVDEIERIADPSIGTIISYDSGKPYRDP